MSTSILSVASLQAMTLEPNRADGEAGAPWLAVDLGSPVQLDEAEARRMGTWLEEQPLPVIAVMDAAHGTPDGPRRILADHVDVQVAGDADLDIVCNAIERNPIASAILVQVLRTVPQLPVPLALGVESLGYATLQGGAEFSRWLAGRKAPSGRAGSKEPPVLLARSNERLIITLDSPGNRNALSVAMRDALTEAFKLVAMDPGIDVVDVNANGPCFSAGGDLTEFGTADDLAMAHRIRSLRMPAQYLAPHAARYTFHLHGACIGAGIELPAFAGRLVAKPDTLFRLPEVAMGLIPGAGGCVSISRRIGRRRTAWMAITGRDIGVREALDWGLVDAIED